MNDLTILYHSSGRESESFEKKVIENINKVKGDIPVVSVTQKPMDFGENICVGWHDCCEVNLFRQRLIGLKAIKTKFVILAESDVLYPPDYFNNAPLKEGHIYLYQNVWVLYSDGNDFLSKGRCEGTQVSDRETMTKFVESILEGAPEWGVTGQRVNYTKALERRLEDGWTGTPVVTCKTGNGTHPKTKIHWRVKPETTIPYWGNASDFKKIYFAD